VILSCYTNNAQSHTEFIADKKVAEKKIIIYGLLEAEERLLDRQKRLVRDIKNAENNYQRKIGPLANVSNTLVYAGIQASFTDLENKISDIDYNIQLRKIIPFGMISLESEFDRQRAYFIKLKGEYHLVRTYSLLSGGAGYNYTALLKILIRLVKIRSNIYEIDKKVRNRMGISEIWAK
jgi:hypothetical protein